MTAHIKQGNQIIVRTQKNHLRNCTYEDTMKPANMTCVHGMYIVVQLGNGQNTVNQYLSVHKWASGYDCE